MTTGRAALAKPRSREEIRMVYVERARLMFADPSCLDEWVEDDTIDGLADLYFWGRDATKLAKATGAKRIRSYVWGFTDVPLAKAQKKYAELARLCAKNDWFVRPDPREHDHHHFLLKATESSPTHAGELVLGSARLFGFTNDYGDGGFPVERCLDAKGNLVRVRVVLGTDAALSRLDALNG